MTAQVHSPSILPLIMILPGTYLTAFPLKKPQALAYAVSLLRRVYFSGYNYQARSRRQKGLASSTSKKTNLLMCLSTARHHPSASTRRSLSDNLRRYLVKRFDLSVQQAHQSMLSYTIHHVHMTFCLITGILNGQRPFVKQQEAREFIMP